MSFDPTATRRIGRRDVAVSLLGVGAAPFGSVAREDSDVSIASGFARLYDAGLRYFDVAPLYGHGLAEHRLGACLRSVDRRTVVISTKVGRLMKPVGGGVAAGIAGGSPPFEVEFDYSYDATMRSLEHSLQRLGTNAIDIALIHDVNRRWQGDMVEQRYREAMGGAHRALVDLRAAGAIKAIGVGVNDWGILLRFAADGDFDCFMLAGPLYPARSQRTRNVPAGLRAPRHLGADGGAVQLRDSRHRRATRCDVLLRRGRSRGHVTHAPHRGHLSASRRCSRGCGAAVSARASRGGERGDRHALAQRRRTRISRTLAPSCRRHSGTSSSTSV